MSLLWRLYGPALLRPSVSLDDRFAAAASDLKAAWRHLLAHGRPSRWTALLAAHGSDAGEALAARDLKLTLLLQTLPTAEPPREAFLQRGADDYLIQEYGAEERVLTAHCAAIERRLKEAEGDQGAFFSLF